MADTFISYSRRDADFVKQLHQALAAQQRDIWVDWEDIPPTAEWWREVQAGIEAANNFVFIISPDSVRSQVCRNEIDHALKFNKRLVPVLRREVSDPNDQALMHPSIGSHNWIFFRDSDSFDRAFAALVKALDTDLSYVREHTRLLLRAREWDNNRRNPAFLLRGDDLQAAERWLAQAVGKEPPPLPLHAEYITASRAAAVRRQRSLLAGVTAALFISVALGLLALTLYGESNVQRGRAETNAATAVAAQGEAQAQAEIAQTQAAIATAAQGEAEVQAWLAQTQAAIATAAQGEAEVQRNIAQLQATAVANERDRAQSIGIAWNAQIELTGLKPERGALLALEALDRFAPTWQAERALALAVRDRLAQTGLNGHSGEVFSAVFSPDGTRVLTASGDTTAQVFDAASGEMRLRLQHGGIVHRALWSPDGTRIATASADGSARVWDARSGQELAALRGHQRDVYIAAWSPDGTRLATAGRDGTARIWDAASGAQLLVLAGDSGHSGPVNGLDWSPDGTRLATAGEDRTAIIWDAASGAPLFRLEGHGRTVNRVVWSPDGRRLATVSDDKTARIWNPAEGSALYTLSGHIGFVTRVAWSPDSREVVTASADGTARVWDATSGAPRLTLFGHADAVLGVTWSPDGRRILTTSRDQTARLWDVISGAQMLILLDPTLKVSGSHQGAVYSAGFSPDGAFVATASADRTARIWQLWTSADSLKTFARECCVRRILTDEERQQFGLPLPPSAPPPAVIASCPYELPSRVYAGARAEVTDDDDQALRVRAGPSLTRSIIASIAPNQRMQVLEGPTCADNIAWFRVIFGINAVEGWVAEGSSKQYFIRPVN